MALCGEPQAAERLRVALTVPPLPVHLDAEERQLVESSLSVHLFHSFAARTHPLTVRHLLREVEPGQKVLDPFSGSGTVLVEAALRGAQGVGMDVGELQVRLARFKATPMPKGMRRSLLVQVAQVADRSDERVAKRRRPARTWDDVSHFEPHVYLELCGLREEIEGVRTGDRPIGEALLLMFSSLIIKASRQRAESSREEVSRTIGKGQVTRWFRYRAEELDRQLAAFADRVPPRTPLPRLLRGDARVDMPALLDPMGTADVVFTSPPYLGVYDYAAHHARRAAWLDIDLSSIAAGEAGEIGARRHGAGLPQREILRQHQEDTDRWVAAVRSALRSGGVAYVLVGDSALPGPGAAGTLVSSPGDAPILGAAERVGLRLRAACAVERPLPPASVAIGSPVRQEHLLHFVAE